MNVIRLAELREEPLSVDEVYAAVTDPAAGGIAVFAGTVRDHDDGRSVTELSYSAHPSAADELRKVAEKIAQRFDLHAVALKATVPIWKHQRFAGGDSEWVNSA